MRPHTYCVAMLALAASAPCQNLIVGDPGAGGFSETQSSSPLTPVGVPVTPFPALFPLPPTPFGGVSHDGTTGLIWHSDGFLLTAEPHVGYPPAAPPIPPLPLPPVFGGAPIFGLAVAPPALVWVTDGLLVAGLSTTPPFPIVVPPFASFIPPIVPPFTGLDWDSTTASLWATDVVGNVFNFFPGGVPAGPTILAPAAFVPPASGMAINKSGTGFGPWVLSTATASILDYGSGVLWPSFALAPGLEHGLSFHSAPSAAPPIGLCFCPSAPGLGQVVRGPMTVTNSSFGVDVTGLAPGTPVAHGFDFTGYMSSFPLVNTVGCGLGLTPGGIFTIGTAADAAGVASLPFSLLGVPIGSTVYMQQITLCAADVPLGVVLTPMHQVIACAP